MARARFSEILRLLAADEVEFIVVGMAAERAGRPKDLAALPVLRATLEELKRQS